MNKYTDEEIVTEDMLGIDESAYKKRIVELEEEAKKSQLFNRLYSTVNYMMCKLGADGEINTQDDAVAEVMEVLNEIDGGEFKEKK